jgi:hypothetical protein
MDQNGEADRDEDDDESGDVLFFHCQDRAAFLMSFQLHPSVGCVLGMLSEVLGLVFEVFGGLKDDAFREPFGEL